MSYLIQGQIEYHGQSANGQQQKFEHTTGTFWKEYSDIQQIKSDYPYMDTNKVFFGSQEVQMFKQ